MEDDYFTKFTRHLCEFLDNAPNMPRDVQMQFKIDVKKVKNGLYHLSNPVLYETEESKSSIILTH